jgi:hypothetical protein
MVFCTGLIGRAQRRRRKPINNYSFAYQARLERGRQERAIARARKAEAAAGSPLYDEDGTHIGWIRLRAVPAELVRRSDGYAAGEGEAWGASE